MKKLSHGFTFVELMVVIGIASILFAIATVSFRDITKNSRDARRKSDMETIRQALELCRSYSGSYPAADGAEVPTAIICNAQTYLTSTPVDPKDGVTRYSYTSSRTTYSLSTDLMENIPGCPDACTYTVTNP